MTRSYESERLAEHVNLRIFPDSREKIEKYLAAYPDRWESESHFIRAAIEHFSRYLATEEYT